MRARHQPDDLLAAARDVVATEGLARLSFGRVAARLGIADRTVVYYFPTKTALVEAVITCIRDELQALLDGVLDGRPVPPDELVRRVWPILSSASGDRTFNVFYELLGLAAAGQPPYSRIAAPFVAGWVEWTEQRVTGNTANSKRRSALAVVARLDGVLLMRQVLGPEASNAAAAELGFT